MADQKSKALSLQANKKQRNQKVGGTGPSPPLQQPAPSFPIKPVTNRQGGKRKAFLVPSSHTEGRVSPPSPAVPLLHHGSGFTGEERSSGGGDAETLEGVAKLAAVASQIADHNNAGGREGGGGLQNGGGEGGTGTCKGSETVAGLTEGGGGNEYDTDEDGGDGTDEEDWDRDLPRTLNQTCAAKEYHLTAAVLSTLPHKLRTNPRNPKLAPMKIYERKAVKAKAYAKHGGKRGLLEKRRKKGEALLRKGREEVGRCGVLD